MANKTLKDMFPDISLNDDDEQDNQSKESSATKAAKKAATELLNIIDEDGMKNKRIVVKVSEKTYLQFNAICKKKGLPAAAVLRPYILDFIRENEGLID